MSADFQGLARPGKIANDVPDGVIPIGATMRDCKVAMSAGGASLTKRPQ
jgi:hypothetical protein